MTEPKEKSISAAVPATAPGVALPPPSLESTDYVPIACELHSEYELAILHRQPLHLVWSDNNVIHDETVLPLDLKTERRHDDSRDGGGRAASGTAAEEFLVCRGKDGAIYRIRLDHVRRMKVAA